MNTHYAVVIPVRNEESTIKQTLTSILNQTIPPQEIHICINASSDNTEKIVRNIALLENKINVHYSEPGKGNAWNKIMAKQSREKILFCDGDVIINKKAAEEMLATFEKTKDLILVGGANAYFSSEKETIFSKYFTENLEGKPLKQDWVCGRLYMTKTKELFSLAEKFNIPLMPQNIINEDQLLDFITNNYKEIIDTTYNLSMQVSTFNEWKISFKRIVAGQEQLKELFPEHYKNTENITKRLKTYVKRFNDIDDWKKKIGVTSLFFLRNILKPYYKISNSLDYNPVWKETHSTKQFIGSSLQQDSI